MTNGQPLVVRAAMKPISTLARPLESVNLKTKQPEAAAYERSDICAVSGPPASSWRTWWRSRWPALWSRSSATTV